MENASISDIASILIRKQFIFPVASILGLGLFAYLTKRYLNTEKQTTNQYYIKPEEQMHTIPNIMLNTQYGKKNVIFVFWNGDLNSTYLLTDLLLQDKIVQPLYIERYTILKTLEYDNLETLTKKYSAIRNTPEVNTIENKKIKHYLEDVARIKQCQNNELTQIAMFRKMINQRYPEFQQNLLPTQYITTITKDLHLTSTFFNILKELEPMHYNGIEFLEQVMRFTKHFINQKNLLINNISSPRILIGYSSGNKNIELVKKILARIDSKINKITNQIELPLQDTKINDIRFLAINVLPNDIMQHLKY